MSPAARILDRCAALARLSALPDGICRVYLSDEHRRANELVGGWMQDAGLAVRVDVAGNVCGRLGAAELPTLLIGSHLDTVPDAGPFDGVLGVLLGIETAAALGDADLPFALEIIGFGEEEGVRFGTTLMTSHACAGTWNDAWWALTDRDGITVAEAFRAFGLDPARIGEAAWRSRPLVGYLEAHIEQGPVLEAMDLPLAVVTAIAGARRLEVQIDGQAGHAGTLPMELRRDALATAARALVLIEDTAREQRLVATVGRIECSPGGVNVVPGRVTFSLDVRADDDAARDRALDHMLDGIAALCRARGLRVKVRPTHEAPATPCHRVMQRALAAGIGALKLPAHHMTSGAGHDAVALAPLCPVGMLFLRCAGGVSHHPDESVTGSDVALAASALRHAVLELAAAHVTRSASG